MADPVKYEVFYARTVSMQMISPSGVVIPFIQGKARLHPEKEKQTIAWLKGEIEQGFPYIYQKEGEELESINEDLMAGWKARMREQIREEERAAAVAAYGNINRDMGRTA